MIELIRFNGDVANSYEGDYGHTSMWYGGSSEVRESLEYQYDVLRRFVY